MNYNLAEFIRLKIFYMPRYSNDDNFASWYFLVWGNLCIWRILIFHIFSDFINSKRIPVFFQSILKLFK
ncbi:hypothetical protein Anas_08631 [Armadillidium nasatum]|uniref:Uncharacterized protein n=1 Tax=Armadillidium nasatum TaxID=96803 RepID=A0A5N5SLH0_9CRUS|nr:hypothetical protein Anas_08631 [Armadillidium nasatum]